MKNEELKKVDTLTDEELDQAAGGFIGTKTKICSICGGTMHVSWVLDPNTAGKFLNSWLCDNCHYTEPYQG